MEKREESRKKPVQNVHGPEPPGCWAVSKTERIQSWMPASMCWAVPNQRHQHLVVRAQQAQKKRSGLSFPRRCTSPQAHAAAFVQPHNAPTQRGYPVMAHTDRRTEPEADTLRDGSRQSARRAPSRARPRWPTPATAPPTPTKHAMVAVERRRKKKEVKKRRAGCVRGKEGETQDAQARAPSTSRLRGWRTRMQGSYAHETTTAADGRRR